MLRSISIILLLSTIVISQIFYNISEGYYSKEYNRRKEAERIEEERKRKELEEEIKRKEREEERKRKEREEKEDRENAKKKQREREKQLKIKLGQIEKKEKTLKFIMEHAEQYLNNNSLSPSSRLYGFSETMKLIDGYTDVNHNRIMSVYGLSIEPVGKLKYIIIRAKVLDEIAFGEYKIAPTNDTFKQIIQKQIPTLKKEIRKFIELLN